MKVGLDIAEGKEKVGLFSSANVHQVVIKAEFSELEKAAIKKLGLEKHTFFKWPTNPKNTTAHRLNEGGVWTLNVGHLVNGWGHMPPPGFESRIGAQKAMQEIEEQFRTLKSTLSAADAPTSKTLDL